jgi:hypothetical protein
VDYFGSFWLWLGLWIFSRFLKSAGNLHIDLFNDVLMVKHLCCSKLSCLSDFLHFIVTKANNNVFRLEISMNNLAHAMHIIKTYETLSSQLSNQRQRDSFVVITLDNLEEINTQDFKYHHKMFSVWTMVNERI